MCKVSDIMLIVEKIADRMHMQKQFVYDSVVDEWGPNMNIRTREEIEQLVKRNTEKYHTDADLYPFTTNAAADEIKISRNMASSYLNDMVKEGTLIKIGGRPVYFLHKKTIEKKYRLQLEANEFDYPEDLREILEKRAGKDSEHVFIGSSMTLNYCLSQCRSAVKYPGNGVPVLIWGEAGTGKSFLADYLYHYAMENQSVDREAAYKTLECTKEDASAGKDIYKLFGGLSGEKDRKGLLKEAEGGVLFINNTDCLSLKAQEMLARYLENRSKEAAASGAKLIFATRKNPSLTLSETLLAQIPVISYLPPLRERSPAERRLLLMYFFEKEELHLNCCITISSIVYGILMKYPFEGNLTQLKSCIKVICANAFLQTGGPKEELFIKSYHLPSELISSVEPEEETGEAKHMIPVSGLGGREEDNYLIPFLKRILDIYEGYQENKLSLKELMRSGNDWLNDFYDFIVYEKKYSNKRIKALEEITGKVLARVSNKHTIFLPASCEFVLARLVYVMTGENDSLFLWMNRNAESIKGFLDILIEEHPVEAFMAKEIKRCLEEILDVELEDINLIFLILNIRLYNRKLASCSLSGLVAAHGYSTASSIVDSVNKLLGKRVLEAFDMPLNTDINDIILKIKEGLSGGWINKNLILLVDMGTLEELGTILSENCSARIGVINNISTKTALSVGEGIVRGEQLQDILKRTIEETQIEYRLYDNTQKEPAILFTSESGTPMTDRVLQIFKDSFPKNIKIRLVAVDCSNRFPAELDVLSARYEILFISGTMNPQIPDIPYIGLEDIIANDAMGDMNSLLERYMGREELVLFDEKLLQNFTLQNVLQYLTILNADKLLAYIKDAVGQLQRRMNREFSVKTIIGIYIHVCCLMERLVTKTPITAHGNLESFEREHKDFIHLVTESFQELAGQYNVRLPVSEMAYLYDYVRHDSHAAGVNMDLEFLEEGEEKES